jgi:hypothetical protein
VVQLPSTIIPESQQQQQQLRGHEANALRKQRLSRETLAATTDTDDHNSGSSTAYHHPTAEYSSDDRTHYRVENHQADTLAASAFLTAVIVDEAVERKKIVL